MLRYKQRLRSGTPVSNWIASTDTKNRGIINKYGYYIPPPLDPIVINQFAWVTRVSNFQNRSYADRLNVHYANVWFAKNMEGDTGISTDAISWVTSIKDIYDLEYGNGIWAASHVRLSNGFVTSTDLITWVTRLGSPGPGKYRNNIWLDGGWPAWIKKSTDLITWVTVTSLLGFTPFDWEYANNMWVIGGNFGRMVRSTDLITWVTINSNMGATAISEVKYGNGLWLINGTRAEIRTSTDTITWITNPYLPVRDIYNVSYGNGLWIAVGNIISSPPSRVFVSTNAINWVLQNSNFDKSIERVEYGNGLWLAGGDYGQLRTSYHWYQQALSHFASNASIVGPHAYGNGAWAIGTRGGQISSSTNAINWTTRRGYINNAHDIWAIAYGNGKFVAVGGSWINYLGYILTSTNATTWTTTLNVQYTDNIGYFWGIGYGNGKWIAISRNHLGAAESTIYSSTDATTWTRVGNAPGINILYRKVAYGNGLWVVGGRINEIMKSTNGTNWVTFAVFGEGNWNPIFFESVHYANGIWMMGGWNGALVSSTDAITWTTRNAGFGNSTMVIQSLGYSNGVWAAGGWTSNGSPKNKEIRLSYDNGITWMTRVLNDSSDTTNGIYGFTYGNDLWVAAGYSDIFISAQY